MAAKSASSYTTLAQDTRYSYLRNSSGNIIAIYQSPTSVEVSGNFSSYNGYTVDGFFEKQRRGELLPHTEFHQLSNTYIYSTRYLVDHPNGNQSDSKNEAWTVAGYASTVTAESYVAALAPEPEGLMNSCAASIYASGFDALTSLSELRKSIDMFRNILLSLRRLLKRTDPARSWLEYRYGWRTLYYELRSLIDTLNNIGMKRTRVSKRVGRSTNGQASFTSVLADSGVHYVSLKHDIEVNASYRASITADISPPTFRFDLDITAWELTRFSFVIDWIIDIGSWLESLHFAALQTNYAGSSGRLIKYTEKINVETLEWRGGYTGTVQAAATRTCLFTDRIPGSLPYIPSVQLNLNAAKVADVLAILKGTNLSGLRI